MEEKALIDVVLNVESDAANKLQSTALQANNITEVPTSLGVINSVELDNDDQSGLTSGICEMIKDNDSHFGNRTAENVFKCAQNVNLIKYVKSEIDLMEIANDITVASANDVNVNIVNNLRELRVTLVRDDNFLQCDECERYFVTELSLIRHLESHLTANMNECIQCGNVLTSLGTLNKIIFKCANCENKCTLCNHAFVSKITLKRHIKNHIRDQRFACPDCDSTFTRKSSLKLHMRTHTRERPFACPDCDSTFTQKGSLKRHIRTSVCSN